MAEASDEGTVALDPPAAVVFDMGGVLGPDSNYAPLLRRLPEGADATAVKAAQEASWERGRVVAGYEMGQYWAPILEAAALPPADWEELDAEVRDLFVPYWEVLAVVDRVRRAGLKVGIISNHLCSWFDHWFQRFGLSELFAQPEMVVVSSRAGSAKPDAAVFQCFCESSGFAAQDCVFVDNKLENVRAAEALGFRGVLFHHRGKGGAPKDPVEVLVEKLRAQAVPI